MVAVLDPSHSPALRNILTEDQSVCEDPVSRPEHVCVGWPHLYCTSARDSSALLKRSCKRECSDSDESEVCKRRRLSLNALAPYMARALPGTDMSYGSAVFCTIKPSCDGSEGQLVVHSGSHFRRILLPKLPKRHTSCAYFVLADHGFLTAHLPCSWKPMMALPGGCVVMVAKLRIDWHDTVYLLSAEDELLAELPAFQEASCPRILKIHLQGLRHLPTQSDEELLMTMNWVYQQVRL
mmetsp:Transcript_97327/g.172300  ORF Transcript_97327/g.172300 Transcript_97327/m.172300 type:complete len:238 (-) Transcript_97327:30-743(-)